MNRAVGWCTNERCDEIYKLVFLINHGDKYFCAKCRGVGCIENEEAEIEKGLNDSFKEVRVEFDWHAEDGEYHGVAIVRDELNPRGGVYTFFSPLVRTNKRALRMAESMLASLQLIENVTPQTQVRTLPLTVNFDDSLGSVKAQLKNLETTFEKSIPDV